MIEFLLVVIIALICLAIYGYTYHILRKTDQSCPDLPACPEFPEIPKCPTCPECNVNCPSIPVCPECKTCADTEIGNDDGKSLMLGFKLNTKSSTVKKLIRKINKVNELATQAFCLNKKTIKDHIKEQLDKEEEFFDMPCDLFLDKLKTEISNDVTSDMSISDELQIQISKTIIEIAELIIPDEICREDNTPSRTKLKRLLYEIIDAFCDRFEHDEYDDEESD